MKTHNACSFSGRAVVLAVSLFALTSAGNRLFAAAGSAMDSQASMDETAVVDRISASFTAFAGSADNAIALVVGLHDGAEISLAETDATTGETTTTTFTPATGPMGYGNVYIALGLAEKSLSSLGIDSPTAADIAASLNGGTVTVDVDGTATPVDLSGVLVLRADGEGWGQIARDLGVKLGPVMRCLNHDAHLLKQLHKHTRGR